MNFNFCNHISYHGLRHISGLSNLTSLSFRRNDQITAQGLSALSGLINLLKLDLERCPLIHGGLGHLKGLVKLESLNVKCCNCFTDADMKHLSGTVNLKELQISCSMVSDGGVAPLRDQSYGHSLELLILSVLDYLAALPALLYLNMSRCAFSDDNCEKFSGLHKLKVLNLGFNDITDTCLLHLKGFTNLESLNLDSVTAQDIQKLQSSHLPHLISFRPE